MEILELKEKIHNKVETSNKKILETIYELLEESTINSFELTDKEADEIDTDVATTTRPINVEENNSIIAATENKTLEDIRFIIIDGKVRGVKMSP